MHRVSSRLRLLLDSVRNSDAGFTVLYSQGKVVGQHTEVSFSTSGDDVVIDEIITETGSRGEGWASKTLAAICRAADLTGTWLRTFVDTSDYYGMNNKAITEWLSRHGFEHADRSGVDRVMLREPKDSKNEP